MEAFRCCGLKSERFSVSKQTELLKCCLELVLIHHLIGFGFVWKVLQEYSRIRSCLATQGGGVLHWACGGSLNREFFFSELQVRLVSVLSFMVRWNTAGTAAGDLPAFAGVFAALGNMRLPKIE